MVEVIIISIAFGLLVFFGYIKGRKLVIDFLVGKVNSIKEEFDSLQHLQFEVEQLYKKTLNSKSAIEKDAKKIKDDALLCTKNIIAEKKKALDKVLCLKKENLQNSIITLRTAEENKLKGEIVKDSVKIVERQLKSLSNDKKLYALLGKCIKKIGY
ncbi:F0F1 ATP synthase subunit B family protein [Candidatus Sneabacter namystus]|uniref:Uncharacterized protein n=1 Tax=Candidatus Sneabacter namystus TaxID=2601646 RepID=A0A5C0UJL8_9RICK|nr:hypothetical protein [Candidatus Sneabacter namystus]QEK39672.1 hypothetical protein FZC37_01860 [Candidatus Sneabacter namystus]